MSLINTLAIIASAFFLTYTLSTEVTDTKNESRQGLKLKNLTTEISGITDSFKNMETAQSSEEGCNTLSNEDLMTSEEFAKANMTNEERIKKTEERRKNLEALQAFLTWLSPEFDGILIKNMSRTM